MVNEWDGEIHDYTKKGGIVHTEIILSDNAPAEFSDRSVLWNSVEKIEKAKNAQLAREIEIALPLELNTYQQINLVREYVKDNFVSSGMCADFAIHDKQDGNPHAHIMLTMRPLKESGEWDAKSRKEYVLDESRNRVQYENGNFKTRKVNTVDWNNKDNAEIWRKSWADIVNRHLAELKNPERVDHRSYKRQGVEKIPSIHMGVAAMNMERRGIKTGRGNINRDVAADNKLLKEIKARITRLYNWAKEQENKPKTENKASIIAQLYNISAANRMSKAESHNAKANTVKDNAALFNFLHENGIDSMEELYKKVDSMNSEYYELRGEIVTIERRINVLNEHLEMWRKYDKNKPIQSGFKKSKAKKREAYLKRYNSELRAFDKAEKYLEKLKTDGEKIVPKQWKNEAAKLTMQKDRAYLKLRDMRSDIKSMERLRKAAEQIEKQNQSVYAVRDPQER